MTDDPTLGEVVRLIERNHAETREAIAAIHQRLDRDVQAMGDRLDKAVPREVHDEARRAIESRVSRVEEDLKSARATTRWAIGLAVSVLLACGAMLLKGS